MRKSAQISAPLTDEGTNEVTEDTQQQQAEVVVVDSFSDRSQGEKILREAGLNKADAKHNAERWEPDYLKRLVEYVGEFATSSPTGYLITLLKNEVEVKFPKRAKTLMELNREADLLDDDWSCPRCHQTSEGATCFQCGLAKPASNDQPARATG